MRLTAGILLGPYEILAPIGAGGMGEVYRARDGRLDRAVAVKILPAEMGSGVRRDSRPICLKRESRRGISENYRPTSDQRLADRFVSIGSIAHQGTR
jgi:serine/threonine protein kinase